MVSEKLSSIIKPREYLASYREDRYVLIDARAGKAARERYEMKHLVGALYVDLDADLSAAKDVSSGGGRRPLPSPASFSIVLGNLGIAKESHVIVYDDKECTNAAARFWWMLKSVGHEKVQVIDGGLEAAIRAGVPFGTKPAAAKKVAPYIFERWTLPLADISETEMAVQSGKHIVVDVRDKEKYDGEKDDIDKVAGHIPGAINVPYRTNLDADGSFLSPDRLRKKYEDVLKDVASENMIVYCGSGVGACHTLLAMDYAGMAVPKLYVGSWSEWSGAGRAVATNKKR